MSDFPTDWCVTDEGQTAARHSAPNSDASPGAGVWVEHLDTDRCWALLSRAPVGRIGVLVDTAPEIYPVIHVVDGSSIVFRSDPSSKLRGLARSPAVSFEVDGTDAEAETDWSVLVKGRAVEVQEPSELRRLGALPLRYWGVGEKPHWIRIVPAEITGRRIHRVRDAKVPRCAP